MRRTGEFGISPLLSIILLLVAAVCIFIFVGKAAGLFSTTSANNQCTQSLMLMDGSKSLSPWSWFGEKERANPMGKPDCPIENLAPLGAPEDGGSEDSIRMEIAEAMRRCWSTRGAAGLDPFGSAYLTDEYYCFLCAKITFSEEAQKLYPSIDGVYEYLRENTMMISGMTYLSYFSQPDTKIRGLPPYEPDFTTPIDTKKTYLVVWHYYKEGSGGVPKFFDGDPVTQARIRFIPIENILDLECTVDTTYT